ncbi:DUF6344 domain-containing protein [Streptomyces sp. NPDC004111]|uniref:DUF6344 domain-containing protein n=1 Tax=Streptomyces sp. NPDC004111 TaxID=3364690 RepID=UPI00368E4E32
MKTMWTALLSAIVALLATLGFAAPANAATVPADTTTGGPADAPQSPAQAPATPSLLERLLSPGGGAAESAVSTRWSADGVMRSVPPTMKQRIRAEAHGGSPSVRQVPALDRTNSLARDALGRDDFETAA